MSKKQNRQNNLKDFLLEAFIAYWIKFRKSDCLPVKFFESLIMWMPGASKPRNIDDNIVKESKPGSSHKEEDEGPNQQKTRNLSGLTMNMKFMKRKANEQENRRHSHDGVIHRQTEETPALSSSSSESFLVATSTDMYCYNNLLGRRSFGNFNKYMENAWTACYEQSKHNSSRPLQSATDEELLQRYNGIGRRKATENNIDDRPVKRNKRRAKTSL